MKTAMIVTLCLALVLLVSGTSRAHSTKGRLKIDLALEQPTVNDFAYFMESYVNKELYRGKFDKWENRFYVKDFKSVELKGNKAVVSFIRLDAKEKADADQSMTFTREKDGVWYYYPDSGERVKVYTFVMKWAYYYQTYVLPFSIPGLIVSMGVLGVLYFRRKRQTRLPLPEETA